MIIFVINICFYARTFSTLQLLTAINQRLDFTVSETEKNIDIRCVQEHRYYYSKQELKYHKSGNGWTFVSICMEKIPSVSPSERQKLFLVLLLLNHLIALGKSIREWCVIQYTATHVQQLFNVTPSTMTYLPLSNKFPNTGFWLSVETWMII